MSGKKYRVEQDGQFLGHHSGHTPQDAVSKMMSKMYGQIYEPDSTKDFICYRGKYNYVVNVSGDNNEG